MFFPPMHVRNLDFWIPLYKNKIKSKALFTLTKYFLELMELHEILPKIILKYVFVSQEILPNHFYMSLKYVDVLYLFLYLTELINGP